MRSTSSLAFTALATLLVLFTLSAAKPGVPPMLKSDEPAYYLMAMSLVHDRDLLCETKDLERLFPEWTLTAENLILMSDDGWRTLYFGKPYVYSLLAAPAAGLFGANGLVAFNMVLLVWMIWLGARYLGAHNPQHLALLLSTGFFVLSSAFSYVFWLHTEVLMMASVMACLYPAFCARAASRRGAGELAWAFVSGAALAVAVYNKPMLALVGVAPLLVVTRRNWRAGAAWLAGAAVSMAALAGVCVLLTGHPSQYLGVQRYGIRHIKNPLVRPIDIEEHKAPPATVLATDGATDSAGDGPAAEPQATGLMARFEAWLETKQKGGDWFWVLRKPKLHPALLLDDIEGFLWGRHVGLLLYTPFAALALLVFLVGSGRTPGRWLLLGSLGALALVFFLMVPHNWHGGAGFIGNRYFITVYPAFLFLMTRIRASWMVVAGWGAGGLLAGPLVLTPFTALVPNGTLQAHARDFPLRYFPRELGVLRSGIPGYRGTGHTGTWMEGRQDLVVPIGDELWLHAATDVDLVFASVKPLQRVRFRVRSQVPDNRIRVDFEDSRAELEFGADEADLVRWIELEAGEPWKALPEPWWIELPEEHRVRYLYRMWVRAERGAKPHWLGQSRRELLVGAAIVYGGTPQDVDLDLYAHEKWSRPPAPTQVVAGERFDVGFGIRNVSSETWPASGALRVTLAYHWLDRAGNVVVRDGRRTALPDDLRSGASIELDLDVEAPAEPGEYVLELDAVREQISWFADRSQVAPVRLPVTVVP